MGARMNRDTGATPRLSLPGGAIATDATNLVSALQSMTGRPFSTASTPLPRTPEEFYALFGPGVPLYPQPFNPARPDTGQPEPRRWQYPVSWNLEDQNYQRLVDWDTLRGAADRVDIIRRCIEIRKAEIVQMDWDITVSRRAMERKGANTTGEKSALRDGFSDEIGALVDWWETPDKTNGLSFSDWMMQVLEEYFVLDALSVYPRMTFGSELASLEVIDGSSIKPLLDERGNIPAPPGPAYQQWLYGFPRGEYTDLGAGGAAMTMQAGQLIYRPRNRRTWTPYGYSPVEQALVTADIYLRRQGWMRSEYTDGTMPTTWLETDLQTAGLTPEQIRAWESGLNDFYSGGTAERHRLRVLPGGMKPTSTQDAAERYKPDYDELLIKLLSGNFDVDPMELGITPKSGLGGKGMADASQTAKDRRGSAPLVEWLTDVFNDIGRRYLGMSPELTFAFNGDDQEDEKDADAIGDSRVSSGRETYNEERDRLGLSRYDGEWADKPMIVTATGPVWLDDAYTESQEPAPVPPALAAHAGLPPTGAAAPAPPDGAAAPPAAQPDDAVKADGYKRTPNETTKPRDKPSEPSRPAAPQPSAPPYPRDPSKADEAKAEMVAFGRFLRRGKVTRDFEFAAIDKADGELLNTLAKADAEWASEIVRDLIKVGWHYVGVGGTASPHPSARGSIISHSLTGGKIEITAAHKKAVKAAKLSTQQQMEYTARRFKGHSHEDALAAAKGTAKADDGDLAKAAGGGAGGRGGAPAGARRGDEEEHAGYPLHAPGAHP